MDIKIPKPAPMNDAQKIAFATEVAFNSLIEEAKKLGLEPVVGLMYLPDQQLTWKFQAACKAVLDSLIPKKEEA